MNRPLLATVTFSVSVAALCAYPKLHHAGDAPSPSAATSLAQKKEQIAPGLVDWHGSMELAKAKAIASGKPILLFQLLGRLDERFC